MQVKLKLDANVIFKLICVIIQIRVVILSGV